MFRLLFTSQGQLFLHLLMCLFQNWSRQIEELRFCGCFLSNTLDGSQVKSMGWYSKHEINFLHLKNFQDVLYIPWDLDLFHLAELSIALHIPSLFSYYHITFFLRFTLLFLYLNLFINHDFRSYPYLRVMLNSLNTRSWLGSYHLWPRYAPIYNHFVIGEGYWLCRWIN